jgi:pyrroline-5-carboxylate reductase
MFGIFKQKIGIIGFGNMGQAIAERIKEKYPVYIFDKDASKTNYTIGLKVAKSAQDLVKSVDALILAVKPQDFAAMLSEISNFSRKKLAISIAAGITTSYIEKFLGHTRVIRVMPNIAARIGRAETCICRGKYALGKDLDFAKALFDFIGQTWILKEEMMDAATAICGSGPAYIYYDMEINKYDAKNLSTTVRQDYSDRLEKAALKVGFEVETAFEFAQATTASSISLSAITGISPAELRKQVASKGGTTEAALQVIMNGGSWENAAVAAKNRAAELSQKE